MIDYLYIEKKLNTIHFVKLQFCDCGTSLETLFSEINQLSKESTPFLFKKLLSCNITNGYKVIKKNKGKIFLLFSNSYAGRKDHRNSFNQVANLASDSLTLSGENSVKLKSAPFNFLGLIWLIQLFPISFPLSYKLSVCIILSRVYLDYSFIKSQIDKNIKNIELFVTFFDCAPIDYLVVCYCNKIKIPTSTLQHGLYFPYDDGVVNIAFRNSPSKYFLSYGEWTNQQAAKVGINDKKLIRLGCPKHINLKIVDTKTPSQKIFGVVLEGLAQGKKINPSNTQLINIANEFAKENNLQYILRLHPNDHIITYKKYIDYNYCVKIEDAKHNVSISDFISEIQFALSNPSTAVAELIYYNKIVYILNQSEHQFEHMNDFAFDNCNLLCKIYKQHQQVYPTQQLTEIKNKFFEPGNIAGHYSKFFKHFI